MKAITSFACRLRCISCGITPNIAATAEGSMSISKTSERALSSDRQNLFNFGQDQNMCARVADACIHRSHIGLILGENLLISLSTNEGGAKP